MEVWLAHAGLSSEGSCHLELICHDFEGTFKMMSLIKCLSPLPPLCQTPPQIFYFTFSRKLEIKNKFAFSYRILRNYIFYHLWDNVQFNFFLKFRFKSDLLTSDGAKFVMSMQIQLLFTWNISIWSSHKGPIITNQ